MNKKLVKLMKERPVEIAKLVGFEDMGDLHNDWIKKMVYGKEDITILGHRSSYKTSCLSIAIALLIILYPFKNIIFLRKTDDDVIEVIRQVSNILKSPVFDWIVEQIYDIRLTFKADTFTKIDTCLNTSNKGAVQLLGIGTNGSLTGKHADIIFTDDIVNLKDRTSKAERDRVKTVYMELQNVKNREGRLVNTGTPWHKEDCISTMPNVHKYDCYSTGLLNKEQLQQLREKMTPSLFSANYELKHIADEDALFANPQFFKDDPEQIKEGKSLIYDGVCHIDAAYGGADSTAFTIIKEREGKFYVYGKKYPKHVDKALTDIYRLQALYRAGTIYCERNADKGYLEKEMHKDGKLVQGYQENMNKYVKIATYLQRNWSSVFFHEDTDPEYLNEILDYTENAQHDDCPDSLASILRELTGKGAWIL